MGRAAFVTAAAAAVVLWWFSPMGLYLLLGIIFIGLISIGENLMSERSISARVQRAMINEGEAPQIVFTSGAKKITGRLVCENVLSHQKQRVSFTISGKDSTVRLQAQPSCGGLKFDLEKLRQFDLCGLTSRKISCEITDKCAVMPLGSADDLPLPETPSGELWISGAKEYAEGDELRHVNFKLTHRFSKIYVNTYAPESRGGICLFFDRAYPDTPEVCARLARELILTARALAAQGTEFFAAYELGGYICEKVTDCDAFEAELMYAETYRGESTAPGFLADNISQSFDRVICYSPHQS